MNANSTPKLQSCTVLIMDDEPTNLRVLVDSLEDHGVSVAVAQDGEEGLMRAQLIQPDLILLDLRMPIMDGFATCRRLKAIESTRDIPVIFMTASDEATDKVIGFDVGAVDYVTKPFQLDEVLARVKAHLLLQQMRQRIEEQNAQLREEIVMREEIERELRVQMRQRERAEALAEQLHNRSPLPIYTLDQDQRLFAVSDGWLDLLGYAREEVLGCPVERFLAPSSIERMRENWEQFAKDNELRDQQFEFIRKTGEIVHALVTSRVERDADGQVVRAYTALVDITGRLAAEVALERESAERQQAEDKLRQAQKMEAIGQLTGGIAHDFNNLLTPVLGNLQLLGKRLNNAADARLVENAIRSAKRGATLTAQLLAFSRKQRLTPRAVDLNSIIGGMHDMLFRTTGGLVRVESDLAADVWPALADPTQMEIMLLNLTNNARDAMEPSGGVLRISTANVGVSDPDAPKSAPPGDYVLLSVADTGCGMSEEAKTKAIEPFFSTKEPGRGTGLGLSQVYGVATQLGGVVEIESALGEGTTVRIYLPKAAGAAVCEQAEDASAPASPLNGNMAHILVVDDDPDVREITTCILGQQGYQITEAVNAREGLDVLEAKPDIALLLVDFAMPDMNGAEMARAARVKRPALPVLMVTGYADTAAIARGSETFPILAKPFTLAELASRVSSALGGQGSQQTAA